MPARRGLFLPALPPPLPPAPPTPLPLPPPVVALCDLTGPPCGVEVAAAITTPAAPAIAPAACLFSVRCTGCIADASGDAVSEAVGGNFCVLRPCLSVKSIGFGSGALAGNIAVATGVLERPLFGAFTSDCCLSFVLSTPCPEGVVTCGEGAISCALPEAGTRLGSCFSSPFISVFARVDGRLLVPIVSAPPSAIAVPIPRISGSGACFIAAGALVAGEDTFAPC